jgi:transcriptional regulator with XRE-family HTH domain
VEHETEKIIEYLRKMRVEKKISVLNLATSAGISHSHLYYIESKRVIPSIDVVIKIAKTLEVPLTALFD